MSEIAICADCGTRIKSPASPSDWVQHIDGRYLCFDCVVALINRRFNELAAKEAYHEI